MENSEEIIELLRNINNTLDYINISVSETSEIINRLDQIIAKLEKLESKK
jgi:hypothetical protein